MQKNPIRIYIVTTGRSYSPESEAYRDFFEAAGHECTLGPRKRSAFNSFDVAILFNGLNPFWHKYPLVVVGEYQSLSTGEFRRAKDAIKRFVNRRSDVKVFLNHYVRKNMGYRDSAEFVYRPMGFFHAPKPSSKRKEFDIVYAGSERQGVAEAAVKLANLGLSVLLVGQFQNFKHPKITVHEPVSPQSVWELLDRASIGLNLVPFRRPFIYQDSTKVIEYASRGLGILSNSYPWVDDFFATRGGRYLKIDDVSDADSVRAFEYRTPKVGDREWNEVLAEARLLAFIERAVALKQQLTEC